MTGAYICYECGAVFECPRVWREKRGEFWGVPAYEKMSGCPHCSGEYADAEECEACGEYFAIDDMENGMCNQCREMELKKQYD